jgi:hypothetical protein
MHLIDFGSSLERCTYVMKTQTKQPIKILKWSNQIVVSCYKRVQVKTHLHWLLTEIYLWEKW